MTKKVRERTGKIGHDDPVLVRMSFRARSIIYSAARDAGFVTKKGNVRVSPFIRMLVAQAPRIIEQAAGSPYRMSADEVLYEFTHIKPGGGFVKQGDENADETDE